MKMKQATKRNTYHVEFFFDQVVGKCKQRIVSEQAVLISFPAKI